MPAEGYDETETEEITITATWRSTSRVEVPKGWRPDGVPLTEWPDDVADAVDTSNAELVDWES